MLGRLQRGQPCPKVAVARRPRPRRPRLAPKKKPLAALKIAGWTTLAVGIASGGIALILWGTVQSQLPAFRQKQQEGKLDNETAYAEGRSLEMMGDAGVGLLITAGVATITGILLIFLPGSPPPRRRPKTAQTPPAKTSATLLSHP